ncbi:MAG: class I SAM-dependent methyltransferase [Clostridia bacterium]|nr:class I SAM-dependent methyltransferase [Clostridia bacterium]
MSFWDSSWNTVDPKRIAEYIGTFDMGEDETIAALHRYGVQSVCDAGCGCGIYALKLAANGFSVSGFDVSGRAVEIAQSLIQKAGYSAELKSASILDTGYAENRFDCVISRDVLDHISKADAVIAVKELCRITKPGGIVWFTLDALDDEYETETHIINADGDYVFTDGKWEGMVFHPYSEEEVHVIVPIDVVPEIANNNGELTVVLMKKNI